ncbi:MAG: aminotransferase class IV [Planctomycetota bacterium]
MPAVTWVNGEFVETDAARVSAFDASVQHAVGLFETMLAVGGASGARVIGLEAHLDRLRESARELALVERLRTGPLGEAVRVCVERSGLAEAGGRARVRLTVTGGDLNLLERGEGEGEERTPTVVIHVSRAQRYPQELFERGVAVTIADARANPLNPHEGHKTLNYWWRLAALQAAARSGAGEALVLQVTNHVCGGAVSNVFVVKDGVLITPMARGEEDRGPKKAIPSPVLPGVTRAQVIEVAEMLGVGTDRRLLAIDDVLDADEVFLTNSSWGVLPVVKVEAEAIGDAVPGGLTTRVRARWAEVVVGEAS